MPIYSLPVSYLRCVEFHIPCRTETDHSAVPRPLYSIALFLSGSALYEADGVRLRVEPGDLLFLSKGLCYRSFFEGDPETNYIAYHFDVAPGSPPFSSRRYPMQKLEDFSDTDFRIGSTKADDATASLLGVSHFYALLASVLPRLTFLPDAAYDERIRPAVQYLEAHFGDRVTVEELAALCRMSVSYFYTCFRRSVGVSPIVYKNRLQIGQAQRLLSDRPDLPVERVAEQLGFESSTYFRRLFHRYTGVSPRAYRHNTAET